MALKGVASKYLERLRTTVKTTYVAHLGKHDDVSVDDKEYHLKIMTDLNANKANGSMTTIHYDELSKLKTQLGGVPLDKLSLNLKLTVEKEVQTLKDRMTKFMEDPFGPIIEGISPYALDLKEQVEKYLTEHQSEEVPESVGELKKWTAKLTSYEGKVTDGILNIKRLEYIAHIRDKLVPHYIMPNTGAISHGNVDYYNKLIAAIDNGGNEEEKYDGENEQEKPSLEKLTEDLKDISVVIGKIKHIYRFNPKLISHEFEGPRGSTKPSSVQLTSTMKWTSWDTTTSIYSSPSTTMC